MSGLTTYLDAILAHHRARHAADERPLEDLLGRCEALAPTRGFAAALRQPDRLTVIAEVKRRSPSKGDLFADLDPATVARAYENGGAAAMSVLTDGPHFGGSPDDLAAARSAVDLPVLRKDFTVGPLDVCDARLMGADAVLLIAAALDDDELADLHALARRVGLDVLVEIHDEAELARALEVEATLVGVNQRDLVTFEVDHDRACRVGAAMPDSITRVAESGVRHGDDARSLAAAGFDAVLVGETLVTSDAVEATVAELAVPRP